MNRQLVLLPLALGSLALAGCSTAPSQTSGSDYSGQFTTASPAFAGSDSGPAAWSYFASATDGSSHYIDYNSTAGTAPAPGCGRDTNSRRLRFLRGPGFGLPER